MPSQERPQDSNLRTTFGRVCRYTRIRLRLTQHQVADAVGLSRAYIATIERLRANPSLDVVERVSRALGLEVELLIRAPTVVSGPRQRDLVHARCSGHIDRRLRTAGWLTAREVEVVLGRSHGWIDLLAFHPRARILLTIEVKTRLDDLGSVERQLGWYERSAPDLVRRLGWHPRRAASWLLVLCSEEVESSIRQNREVLGRAFPARAREMLAWLEREDSPEMGRGIAMIDPASKRRDWLIRSRIDGRRSPSPYVDYADASRRLAR